MDKYIEKDTERNVTSTDSHSVKYDKDGIRLLNYSDYVPSYMEENKCFEYDQDGNGYTYSLPFFRSTDVMAYDEKFFNWASQQDEINQSIFIPSTWAEVKSVGLAVKNYFDAKNVWGKYLLEDGSVVDSEPSDISTVVYNARSVSSSSFSLLSYDQSASFVYTLLEQYGSKYIEIDKEQKCKGYAAFLETNQKDKTIETFDLIKELNNLGVAIFLSSEYTSNLYKWGRSLLAITSSAAAPNYVKPMGAIFSTGFTAVPQKDINNRYYSIQGINLAMLKSNSIKQNVAAWKLMVYLTQQANDEILLEISYPYFPVCKSSYQYGPYYDYLIKDYEMNMTVKANQDVSWINEYQINSPYTSGLSFLGFSGSSVINYETSGALNDICSNAFTSEQVFNKIAGRLSDYIRN